MRIGAELMDGLLATYLARRLRYRCLVLQTGDLGVLSELCEAAIQSARQLDGIVQVLEYRELMDEVGALPCSRVLEKIEVLADSSPLVVGGPLHFLEYWSQRVAAGFWEYLASYSTGPGILVLDGPREQGVLGAFRLVRIIPGTDIRVFKSRLATAEDGLV